jgi:hypothetical protein
VKNKTIRSSVQKRLLEKLIRLWPALKGSLALVHKPCIRPNCRACARGDKHPNYLLTFVQEGRRRCLYVPLALVPALERALANGRQIEQLLFQMGPALVREYRTQHPARTGPAVRMTRSATKKNPAKKLVALTVPVASVGPRANVNPTICSNLTPTERCVAGSFTLSVAIRACR